MTTFSSDIDLRTQFYSPSRVWAGGGTNAQREYDPLDPILVNSGVTVMSEDGVIVTPRLQEHSGSNTATAGTLNLTNCVLDIANQGITIQRIDQVNANAVDVVFATSNPFGYTNPATNFTVPANSRYLDFRLGLGVSASQRGFVLRTADNTNTISVQFNESTRRLRVTTTGGGIFYEGPGGETFNNRIGPHFANFLASYETFDGTGIVTNVPTAPAVQYAQTLIGGSSPLAHTWRNTRVSYTGPTYCYFGNFHARDAGLPTYSWNNVEFEGDVDAITGEAFISPFTGAIDLGTSQFNDVSFWNGFTLASGDARGGIWQTTTGAIYNNTLLGPFGTPLNGRVRQRMLARFANQGNVGGATGLSLTNHAGLATNYDMRSLGQITAAQLSGVTNPASGNTSLQWYIDLDTAANIWFINPLWGRPASDARDPANGFRFVNAFGQGGEAHVAVAASPRLTNNRVADAFHHITFPQTAISGERAVVVHRGAWNYHTVDAARTNAVPVQLTTRLTSADTVASSLIQDDLSLIFRTQHADFSSATGVAQGGINDLITAADRIETIEELPDDVSFRKYSWRQQSGNFVSDSDRSTNPDNSWGKLVTISTPNFNATDQEVEVARTGGFHQFNGSTWDRQLDIVDPDDIHLAALNISEGVTAYNSPTATATRINISQGVTTGDRLAAISKLAVWNRITAANVPADNEMMPLVHSQNGAQLQYTLPVTLSPSATTVTYTPQNLQASPSVDGILTVPVHENGIQPEALASGIIVRTPTGANATAGRLSLEGAFLQTVTGNNANFTYTADQISMGGSTRIGTFIGGTNRELNRAELTTIGSGFFNMPSTTIPSNMILRGTIVFTDDNSGLNMAALSFGPGVDTSQLNIINRRTAPVVLSGRTGTGEFRTVEGTFTYRGTVDVTFQRAGQYFLGRERAGAYTPQTTGLPLSVAAGATISVPAGIQFLDTDDLIVYFKPANGTDLENETYPVQRLSFPFGASAALPTGVTIASSPLSPQLLVGVNASGAFVPPTGTDDSPQWTPYFGAGRTIFDGQRLSIEVGGDLTLVQTKAFFIWLQTEAEYLRVLGDGGYPVNSIQIDVNGIAVNTRPIVLARGRATNAPQRQLTGVTATNAAASGTPALIRPGVSTVDQTLFFIDTDTNSARDYFVQLVPEGVSVPEIVAAVNSTQAVVNLTTDVQAMRTNRLLGIRPQNTTSGGDFTIPGR